MHQIYCRRNISHHYTDSCEADETRFVVFLLTTVSGSELGLLKMAVAANLV